MEYNVSDLVSFMQKMELKYDLFSKSINGIYYWKPMRFDIYFRLAKSMGVLEDFEPVSSTNRFRNIIDKIKAELIIIKSNALTNNYTKEILIFQSSRKSKIDDEYIDIYTHYLIDSMKDKINNIEILESTFFGDDYYKVTRNKLAILPSFVARISIMLNKLHIDSADLELMENLRNDILQRFNTDLNIISIAEQILQRFHIDYSYYNRLIRKRHPKQIYIVCSYGREALIGAAQKNGVETIEIQHGTMSKYHVGYSFPNNDNIPYFPDKMLLYGQYWSDTTPIPLPKDRLLVYGNPYFTMQIKKYAKSKRLKNNILFLSQPTIGKALSEIAYDFANMNNDYNIIFKLHPNEYNSWKNNYAALVQANDYHNFTVIDNYDKNMYELFAECEYQIGVYSTAIYEGVSVGLKTILINLPGIEELEVLIGICNIPIVDNANDIFLYLNNGNQTYIDKDYLFKENNM